jgi:hypothetical protein
MTEKKRRGRKPNPNPGKKVEPMLAADTYACLEYLAGKRRYGANPSEVARYMILREVDEMTRVGIIPLDLPKTVSAPAE